jgi:hypothetical protein
MAMDQALARVTFPPTSAERVRSDPTDSLLYLPLPSAVYHSDTLAVRVRGTDPATGADTVAHSWVVRYRIVDPAVPEGDTTLFLSPPGASQRVTADTTDTRGIAAVQVALRFAAVGVLVPANGTVTVEAHASYRGQELAGSPVTFRVHVAQQQP